MISDPKQGDIVVNDTTGEYSRIVDVSNKWGWVKVEFFKDYRTKYYNMNVDGIDCLSRVSPEERADLFLRLENAGITDYWQD